MTQTRFVKAQFAHLQGKRAEKIIENLHSNNEDLVPQLRAGQEPEKLIARVFKGSHHNTRK